MRGATKISITFALCLAAAGLGWGVARREQARSRGISGRDAASSKVRSSASAEAGGKDLDSELRRLTARCDTAALWQWLEGNPAYSSSRTVDAAVEELLDREGVGAIRKVLNLDESKLREWLSGAFLAAWAKRDVWGAYDIYLERRHEFDERWGGSVLDLALAAGCEISADKVIEMVQANPGDMRFIGGKYPADFDFAKLVSFFEGREEARKSALAVLVPDWAKRSPGEAAAWCVRSDWKDPHSAAPDDLELYAVAKAVAESQSPERMKGLETLAQMPQGLRDNAWRRLGEYAANSDRVEIEPRLLEAANAMGASEAFLTPALLGTRGEIALDGSWSLVPPEGRTVVMERALVQWEKEDPSPSAGKARERWKAVVEGSWGK
jgi:hypothetical protein